MYDSYELDFPLLVEGTPFTDKMLMKKIVGHCNGELVKLHQATQRADERIVEWKNLLEDYENKLTVVDDMIMIFEKQEETDLIEDELYRLDKTRENIQTKIESTIREIKMNKLARESSLKTYSRWLDYYQLLNEIEGEIE